MPTGADYKQNTQDLYSDMSQTLNTLAQKYFGFKTRNDYQLRINRYKLCLKYCQNFHYLF